MNTIFTDQNTAHLFELFLWMLGSFLLGWILSRLFSSKEEKLVEKEVFIEKEVIVEKKIYIDKIIHKKQEISAPVQSENAAIDHQDSTIINSLTANPKEEINVSTQTRKTSATEILNYDSFGKASESEKDDLKRISGIGLSIETKLNGIGIFTYQQISKFSSKDMTDITDLITFFPGRIERDNWVQQAKKLVNGVATDFSKRVDKGDIY